MANLLTISDEEWKNAEEFFRRNKHETKLSKPKGSTTKHSFIKIPGKNPKEFHIFAMASSKFIGSEEQAVEKEYATRKKGTSGEVKVVQSRNGDNFAVKIEGRGLRSEDDIETKITTLLGFTIGQAERLLTDEEGNAVQKDFLGTEVFQKLYTVMQLGQGKDLEEHLYLPNSNRQRTNTLSETQKLIMALKICDIVQSLHDKNIIHGDLKPANLMSDIKTNENQIVITAVDFGLSKLLPPGQSSLILEKAVGSPLYMAPELYDLPNRRAKQKAPLSFASDIYALGIIFKEDFQLSEEIHKKMLADNPADRDKLEDVRTKIYTDLVKATNLNKIFETYKDYKNIKQEYDSYRKGSSGKSMRTFAKNISYAFTNKKNKRIEQMGRLNEIFDELHKDVTKSSDEKASQALGKLFVILDEINESKGKHFKLKSSLEATCTKVMSDIISIVGHDKFMKWYPARISEPSVQNALQRKTKFSPS